MIAQAEFDLSDPFVIPFRGKYYMFVSTAFLNSDENIPVLESDDGSHWNVIGDALPTLPPWVLPTNQGGNEWAPAVYELGGQVVMYYAATLTQRVGGSIQHCVGVATAPSPDQPFAPASAPLLCDSQEGGDIDASLFVDPTGPDGPQQQNYLVWKSDNNSTPGTGVPTAWVQPLSDDGLVLLGQAHAVYQPTLPWQHDLIDSPRMVASPDGRLWLLYSAGGFASPDYAVGVAECDDVFGPCQDVSAVPFLASNSQGLGPGEETTFTAPDGTLWLIYDPWYAGSPYAVARAAAAVPIGWNAEGPYLAAKTAFPPPPPAPAPARRRPDPAPR